MEMTETESDILADLDWQEMDETWQGLRLLYTKIVGLRAQWRRRLALVRAVNEAVNGSVLSRRKYVQDREDAKKENARYLIFV
jgi:hypothetical protein